MNKNYIYLINICYVNTNKPCPQCSWGWEAACRSCRRTGSTSGTSTTCQPYQHTAGLKKVYYPERNYSFFDDTHVFFMFICPTTKEEIKSKQI